VAKAFLLSHGLPEATATNVWTAVALHTTPGIPELLSAEIALVTAGVETDVLGVDYAALSAADITAVTDAHPRPDFKRQILAAFTKGTKDRPDTTFGNVNADVLAHFSPGFHRADFVDITQNSPWAEHPRARKAW
jgi:hypothetical protein